MKVFLSYEPKSANRFVSKLSPRLAEHGIVPLAIHLQNAYGSALDDEKVLAVTADCHKILVMLNRPYVSSSWNQQELRAFVYAQASQHRKDWLVPVQIGQCRYLDIFGQEPVDFTGQDPRRFEAALGALLGKLDCAPQVFVTMSFVHPEVKAMYQCAKKVFVDGFGYRCVQLTERAGAIHIVQTILTELSKSDVVLVDLTGNRQNCYYEAGYADALRKEIIFTIKDGEHPHFNLQGRRHVKWRPGELAKFTEDLRSELEAVRRKREHLQNRAMRAADTAAGPAGHPQVMGGGDGQTSRHSIVMDAPLFDEPTNIARAPTKIADSSADITLGDTGHSGPA